MTDMPKPLYLWVRGLLRFLEKRYKPVLLGCFLSLFVAVFFISKLEIKSGFEDLLPQKNRAVQILKQIPKKVGGAKYLKIAITTDDTAAAIRFVDDYANRLKQHPEIAYVRHKFDNQFFRKHFLQLLSDKELVDIHDQIKARVDYEKLASNPFYFSVEDEEPPTLDFLDIEKKLDEDNQFRKQGYYVTKDGKTIFILVRPKGFSSNIKYSRKLLNSLDELAASSNPTSYHSSIEVHHLGPYYSSVVEYDALVYDVTSTAVLSLFLLLLLFFFYFRKIRALLYIVSAPIVGVVWTFALTYFMIGHLNTQTAFLAAILMGLVVDFSIHLTSRFFEEHENGLSKVEALFTSLTTTGYAVFLAGISTCLAFGSLIFSDFVGFWQFGLIASVGVIVCVLVNYTLLPALVFWLEPEDRAVVQSRFSLFHLFESVVKRVRVSFGFIRATVGLAVLAILVSAFVVPSVEFEYDLRNLRSTAFAKEHIAERLQDVMGRGTTPSAIFLTDGLEESKIVDSTLQGMMKSQDTTIGSVRSVYDFVARNPEQKVQRIQEIRDLVARGEKFLKAGGKSLEDIEKFKPYLDAPIITLRDVPEDFLVEFRDIQGNLGSFVLVYSEAEQSQMKEMIKHAAEVRDITAANGKHYYSSGESIIFSDMLDLMKTDGRSAILLALLLIFLVVLLQTKNLKATSMILVPLYLGTLMICTAMVVFEIKLNFFNIIIFPLIIGIGVDNGIHMYSRFQELHFTDVRTAVVSVGRAILMTSLTTMIGFAALLFAKSMALNSVGLLAVTGVAFCWLTAVTFLPALFSVFYREKSAITSINETTKQAINSDQKGMGAHP